MVDLLIQNGDLTHSYVNVSQSVNHIKPPIKSHSIN